MTPDAPTHAPLLDPESLSAGQEKLILNLTYKCNNHCTFCSIAGRPIEHADFATLCARLKEAKEAGLKLLDLDGGEPTLYPELFPLLDEALALGFSPITLTSNGRRLADRAFMKQLAHYPLNLLVSLHAADAATQDGLTTQEGSFRQTVKGLLNALPHFPELGVNTTLVRANQRGLDDLARLLIKLGVRQWNLQLYTPFGQVDSALAPDPYEVGPLWQELQARYGAALRIQGINLPFCLLPQASVSAALSDANKSVRIMRFVDGREVNLAAFLGEKRFRNAACRSCTYAAICQGFWDYRSDAPQSRPWRGGLVDLIPDYACNSHCRFCAIERGPHLGRLDRAAWERALRDTMAFDPTSLRIGGGEPTLREDLPDMLRLAKELGFQSVAIQSNGYRLGADEYRDALIAAGLNAVHISTRGHLAATHDELCGVAGSFALTLAAIRALAQDPRLELTLDALLLTPTLPHFPEELSFWYDLGVRRINLWVALPEGRARAAFRDLVPHRRAAAQAIRAGLAALRARQYAALKIYYLPTCLLKGHETLLWHPMDENCLVITPDSRFRLEHERFALLNNRGPCTRCTMAARCTGLPPAEFGLIDEADLSPYP